MYEMYHDAKFLMNRTTQVREAWWPDDRFYQVFEVFPQRTASEYFTVNPKLPRNILKFLSDSIKEVKFKDMRTSESSLRLETASVPVHGSRRKAGKERKTLRSPRSKYQVDLK
eukprot:GEMP01094344.1.p1 GENE.GEMP01094344.1~~GEMP01094344.1.p1  ORF type:complete len:113 (+),score=21.35 GEMP01094344.1:334-672(+)